MAGQNQFYPIATGSGANVLTPASWLASAVRQSGFQSGIASSTAFNTAWRQPSQMAAMFGQFIAAQNLDALDDGDIDSLLENYRAALLGYVSSNIGLPAPETLVHFGTATNIGNAYSVAALMPAITALVRGMVIEVEFPAPNTGPSTLTFNNLPAPVTPAIVRMDGSALKQNDIVAGTLALSVRSDGRLGILNYNPTNAPLRNSLAFRASASWAVPEGCYFVYAQVWGAGGGGGGSVYNNGGTTGAAGAGGGGGGYDDGFFFVTPGQTLPITVGQGGTPGTGANSGGSGGVSSVGSLVSATGGQGGAAGVNQLIGTGNGNGGQGIGGAINATGTSGGTAFSVTPGSSPGAAGGIGGASPFGSSSPSLNVGTAGNSGGFPGGGANAGANNGNGGQGGAGLIRLSY